MSHPAVQIEPVSNLTSHRHGGNLATVRVCLKEVITEAWANDHGDTILLFGYPGSGKSSLIRSVGSDLASSYGNAEIVTVGCHRLVSSPTKAGPTLDVLQDIEHRITSGPNRPRVLVLDEFDAISIARSPDSAEKALCWWSMSFLEVVSSLPKTVVLLITNFPDLIDPAVLGRVQKALYLPFPDEDAISTIIESLAGPANVRTIAAALSERCIEHELQAAVRGLVNGLNFSSDRSYMKGGRLKVPVSDVADAIIALAGFPSRINASEYERNHSIFRIRSEFLIKCYR